MLRITSMVITPAILLIALYGTAAADERLEKNRVCSDKPFANTINLKLTWIKIQGGNSFLFREAEISLMLPCPVSVYVQDGKTFISTLRPRVVGEFYPNVEIKALADEVDEIVVSVINESK